MKKALILNGSPRKGWNTDQLLRKVEQGMRDIGAEVKYVDLYDVNFTGCKSCFACKLKGHDTHGLCTYPDGLKPVMESMCEADAVVLGTPVYLAQMSAQTNLFWERLSFANVSYSSYHQVVMPGDRKCALVVSMGCPENLAGRMGYTGYFDRMGQQFGLTLGSRPARMLYCYDTYQFKDYSKIEISPDRADPVLKAEHRERQFPIDLQRAYDLGVELCS